MYRQIKIFELHIDYNYHVMTPPRHREILKRYGSRRSGTIYIAADDPHEAKHIFQEFLKEQEGIRIPGEMIHVDQTHLIPKAIIGPRP